MMFKRHLPLALLVVFFQGIAWMPNLNAQADDTALSKVKISLLIEKRVKPVSYSELEEKSATPYKKQDTDLYYWSTDQYKSVSIKPNTPSTPFEYSGSTRLLLYEKLTAKGPDGEDRYRPTMEADLSLDITDYFLIGTQQRNKSTLQKLITIPVSPAKLSKGSILAINLSSKPLIVAYEDTRTTLNPLEPILMDISKTKEFKFRILAAIEDGGEFQMVYRRVWSVKPTTRGICLFFPTNEKMTRWNTDLIQLSD